jgi:anthranilate phosphoribosyltransferase
MSETFPKMLDRLLDGHALAEAEASQLMRALASGELDPALAGALLAALRAKGETAEEIRGFAMTMRELVIDPELPTDRPAVDTVGTGGDGSGSLNLSTGTGLLAAACGTRVVKHGNRSISSKSGSADILEYLGLPLPLDGPAARELLLATGFTFLFAPAYHPAMKAVVPVRGPMGVRTVFNFLGPLTNPAAPPYQVIGAFSHDAAKLMANALAGMPLERAFVVHGEPGWDEATPAGAFAMFDVRDGHVTETRRTPEDYGVPRCEPKELVGGDAVHNGTELKRVFDGDDKGAHRNALLMGTSLALEVCGAVSDAKEGVAVAANAIDNGDAAELLQNIRRHFGK